MVKISILDMSLKMTNLELAVKQYVPGANELNIIQSL